MRQADVVGEDIAFEGHQYAPGLSRIINVLLMNNHGIVADFNVPRRSKGIDHRRQCGSD